MRVKQGQKQWTTCGGEKKKKKKKKKIKRMVESEMEKVKII